jgi:hypothetical protein
MIDAESGCWAVAAPEKAMTQTAATAPAAPTRLLLVMLKLLAFLLLQINLILPITCAV